MVRSTVAHLALSAHYTYLDSSAHLPGNQRNRKLGESAALSIIVAQLHLQAKWTSSTRLDTSTVTICCYTMLFMGWA